MKKLAVIALMVALVVSFSTVAAANGPGNGNGAEVEENEEHPSVKVYVPGSDQADENSVAEDNPIYVAGD